MNIGAPAESKEGMVTRRTKTLGEKRRENANVGEVKY
jgi:hypothetical protein